MLKTMRKNLKSLAPTLWIVIAAFIIAIFAVWGGAGRLGEARAANTIAWVGKEKISADLYYQNLRQRLEGLKREFKELDQKFIQQLNIPQQVLEQLIQQSLLLQKAREMGIDAMPEEIREKVMSYPVFQKDGKFIGFEEYKKILDWNRIPVDRFEQSLRQEIIISKLIRIITAAITVTEDELLDEFKKKNESARIEYVVLEIEAVEEEKELSLAEAQAYFEKHKENFRIPEKREGDMIFLKTQELESEIELGEQEIEKYYKDNMSQFQEPEKIRVSRIYLPFEDKEKGLVLTQAREAQDRIRKGEDFAQLARTLSKDEKAKEGGDWGLFDWKRLSEKEQKEIERLSQGEISAPIELEDGVVLLKITEKTAPLTKPFIEVKDRITTILKEKKARELAEKRISMLQKSARKEKSLDVAAQKVGLMIRKTGLLKEGEEIQDIDPSGAISRTLFSLDEKEISSPVYTYKGLGIVQLKKISPAHQATFDEVQEEVKKELIGIKKKEKALEKIRRVRSELEKEKSLETLAEKYDLEYKTAEEHKRGQYLSVVGENEEMDRLAFSLPLGEVSEPIPFQNGYALLRVKDRKEISRQDFEKNKKEERQTLLEAKMNKFLHSYIYKLRNEMGVKIKYDLFLKVNSDVLSRFQGEQSS
ncbi:MAG: SurA N-terminal domain-containing protein [Candidatus Aminicenantales bacterium]